MKNNTIYAFVGPIGGGKTHQLNELRKESEKNNIPFVDVDFSDGIRGAVSAIFGVPDNWDTAADSYAIWKSSSYPFAVPSGQDINKGYLKGRDMLKNIGDFGKELAGEDIWAKYAERLMLEKFSTLDKDQRRPAVLAFGSLRFPCEAAVVFHLASLLNKYVKIIFCNFHSVKYDNNVLHDSERMANELLLLNCMEGDDVTETIKRKYLY